MPQILLAMLGFAVAAAKCWQNSQHVSAHSKTVLHFCDMCMLKQFVAERSPRRHRRSQQSLTSQTICKVLDVHGRWSIWNLWLVSCSTAWSSNLPAEHSIMVWRGRLSCAQGHVTTLATSWQVRLTRHVRNADWLYLRTRCRSTFPNVMAAPGWEYAWKP